MSVAFGHGFLFSENLCGALSGMGIALGGIFLPDNAEPTEKKAFTERFKITMKRFEEKYGSVNCRELIRKAPSLQDVPETEYNRRHCLVYMLECVGLIEEELNRRD